MKRHILHYDGKTLRQISERDWRQNVQAAAPEGARKRLGFMTAEHHEVRYFAVRQLPLNQGRPLTPQQIAEACSLSIPRVQTILDELERHLFFLVRDERGNVSWAFPFTVDETPHALTFNHGERLFAA